MFFNFLQLLYSYVYVKCTNVLQKHFTLYDNILINVFYRNRCCCLFASQVIYSEGNAHAIAYITWTKILYNRTIKVLLTYCVQTFL